MAHIDIPKLANISGRSTLIWNNGYADVESISDEHFSRNPQLILENWKSFEDWAVTQEPEIPGTPDPKYYGPPIPNPRQIFAIGLNYREHANEAGYDTSGLPQVFTKFPSCLTGPYSDVMVSSPRLDWEVELVIVIGQSGRKISESNAWSSIAGFMIGQDLSARDIQLSGQAPQWSLGKSFEGFGPIGPYLTSTLQLPHPDDLVIECEINGEIMQSDRTSNMIWSIPELISRLSYVCQLNPGDLIFSGTPKGVGNRRTPPMYLKPGDRLASRITGLGELINRFVPQL